MAYTAIALMMSGADVQDDAIARGEHVDISSNMQKMESAKETTRRILRVLGVMQC